MTNLTAETLNNMPTPDWAARPWGRPTIHQAKSEANPHMVGTAEFRYHGLRVRGVRIYRNVETGVISVSMPTRRFAHGDNVEVADVVYFHNPVEREQFVSDVAWLWQAIFGVRNL